MEFKIFCWAMLIGCSLAQQTREIVVNASHITGKLKNLQGTNSADTDFVPSSVFLVDDIHNKEQEIAELFPEYAIKHVLIYTFPDFFEGFGKTGIDADPTRNENYNWTLADEYMRFVTSHGAKASIQFTHTNATNPDVSSPEILGQIGYMVTDRYVNGAFNSGFIDALELFEFQPESDLANIPAIEEDYANLFEYFAGFSRGVVNASSKAGVGAWGGNRIYPVQTNYSVYDPFVAQFYKDCYDRNVPVKAATYHLSNTQFSFNPHDVKTITDKFRSDILVPAGLGNLSVWVTEFEPNPYPVLPTSPSALNSINDPAFFASYMIGVSMYAQDTSVEQALSWPGFGYAGMGGGNQSFQGFFEKSSSKTPIPLLAANAFLLQAKLVTETPRRVQVDGHSADGFAVLAGRSNNDTRIQIFLNNYQFDYSIAREITAQLVPLFNTSTTAYPLVQSNGLLNGESACFASDNAMFHVPACLTFVQATIRENHSQAYHLRLVGLPWGDTDGYRVQVRRADPQPLDPVYRSYVGKGNTIDLTIPITANAQDLVTVEKTY